MNNTTPNTTPTVSIIIPTYNSAQYLARAIDSVLAQTYRDWELLVIDDASTDTTAQMMKEYTERDSRIFYLKNEKNLGISKTRNRGLHEARGQYIAMLDSDDVWIDPEKLSSQTTLLDQNPRLGLVGTWVILIDENDKEIGRLQFETSDADIRNHLLYKYQITQSSIMFRKKAAAEAGNYDETLATAEDYDLWLKIGKNYEFAILNSFALGYRVHKKSITKHRKVRLALDGLAVVMRHRHEYPNQVLGIGKGVARLIVRAITPF